MPFPMALIQREQNRIWTWHADSTIYSDIHHTTYKSMQKLCRFNINHSTSIKILGQSHFLKFEQYFIIVARKNILIHCKVPIFRTLAFYFWISVRWLAEPWQYKMWDFYHFHCCIVTSFMPGCSGPSGGGGNIKIDIYWK